MDATCECCGATCDSEEDRCFGCEAIVCVECVDKYEHALDGRHFVPKRMGMAVHLRHAQVATAPACNCGTPRGYGVLTIRLLLVLI